jgi:hypothetical protein
MHVFADTEFTDLTADAKLISIGLVTELGSTFYAELSDTYALKDCSDFVLANVVPHLEGGSLLMPLNDLRQRLFAWLASLDEHVVLAMDDGRDWGWIRLVLADRWPDNVETEPDYLNLNYLNDADAFFAAVEAAFQAGFRRHHALDDAKSNRQGWFASEHLGPPLRTQ